MNDISVVCFLSVVRTRSFAVSAAEMSITRQAVSRSIQSLEQELGFTLFHRDYHSLRLTEAGVRFYNFFSRWDEDMSTASRLLSDADGEPPLRVGWSNWTGSDLRIHDLILKLARDENAPKIRVVQTGESDIGSYLIKGEVDTTIMSRYLASGVKDACKVTELTELPVFMIISSKHPILNKSGAGEIMQALPCFASRASEDTEEAVIRRIHREYAAMSLIPKEVVVLPNLDSVYIEVMMGNGIAISPENPVTSSDAFSLFPLPISVTLTMVHLESNRNPFIPVFKSRLLEIMEDRK